MLRSLLKIAGFLALLFLITQAVPRYAGPAPVKSEPQFTTFTDITQKAGLGRKITIGDAVSDYLIDVKAGGACFFDYDNDGFQDLFLVNGSSRKDEREGHPPHDYLFHNNGDETFTEVTAQAHVLASGWHTGCAVGDIDNDGYLDLYVTNYGPNILYRNNGDGTFTDVTAKAGVAGPTLTPPKWSMGAAFGDIDNDGLLDLYVTSFVKFGYDMLPPPSGPNPCKMKDVPIACPPDDYPPRQHQLYRNNGDGTFTDVSESAGILRKDPGKGFGVVFSDFTNRGVQDMYVVCDAGSNFYYINDGKGHFTDYSLASGTALTGFGNTQGTMGVWVGDVNHDGLQDIVIGTFIQQLKALYINQGNNFFTDQAEEWGIGGIAYNYSTWGMGMLDFDNDTFLDMWITNGHTSEQVEKRYPEDTYAEASYVLKNLGGKRFVDLSKASGIYAIPDKVGRGTAFGDFNNDGNIDVLVVNKNDFPVLWRNNGAPGQNWITVRTEGVKSNRPGFGAKVISTSGGGIRQVYEVRGSGSFLSSSDVRVHIGLAEAKMTDLEIRWPSGQIDRYSHVAANQFYLAREGDGLKPDPFVKAPRKSKSK